MAELTAPDVQAWLVEKTAHRLNVTGDEVDVDQYFDEFGLESTEALVLAASSKSGWEWNLRPPRSGTTP